MSLFSLFSPHLLQMCPPRINDDLNFLKRRQHVGERWVDKGDATKSFRLPRRYCTTENECCEDIKSCQFFGKKWKVQIRLHLLRMFEKSLDIRNVFSYNMKRISDVWPSKSIKMDCLKTAHHRISICVHLRDTIKRCRVRQVIISITGRFFYPAFCSFANTHMCK